MPSPLDTATTRLHDLIVSARHENPGTSADPYGDGLALWVSVVPQVREVLADGGAHESTLGEVEYLFRRPGHGGAAGRRRAGAPTTDGAGPARGLDFLGRGGCCRPHRVRHAGLVTLAPTMCQHRWRTKENPAVAGRGSGQERNEMTENDDNTCGVCGDPLNQDWYPTAPWVPKRLGGAGRPDCAEKRGNVERLTDALDKLGAKYTIAPM